MWWSSCACVTLCTPWSGDRGAGDPMVLAAATGAGGGGGAAAAAMVLAAATGAGGGRGAAAALNRQPLIQLQT